MSDNIPTTDDAGLVPTDTDLTPTPFGTVGTDFLMFAVGSGANIENQSDYLNDPQRPTGNQPGIARSNFMNKATRQGTFVAHSLCLWISEQIQVYIPDDGNDIAWIGEFSQALADFILATIPPPPNLGLFLPLAGGQMSGNITFLTGISTVLANNTWYFARDTGGQARGLITKGADNNVYVNDGSSSFVIVNGTPTLNNNFSWSGRSVDAVTHPVIGLLSDDNVHVAGGKAGHIYLDCSGGGSVWTTSNIVIPNNSWYYAKDSGGTTRTLLGLNTGNACLINSGGQSSTDIYAGGGQPIYLHSNTVALGLLQVNSYFYMQGGARAYIPGGNDPFLIYADPGYYARLHYVVGNTRDWSEGALSNGYWAVADETAHAIRLEIDFNGLFHCFNSLQVDGDSTVNGAVSIGSLAVAGAASVSGGLTVYNGLYIQSGAFNVNGPSGMGGPVTMYNGLNVAGGATTVQSLTCTVLGVSGSGQINGGLTVYNGLNVASGNASVAGTLTVGGGFSIGGGTVNDNLTVTNTLQVNNWASIYNGLTVQSGAFVALSSGQVNGGLTVYNSINVASGGLTVAGAASIGNSLSVSNTLFVYNQAQVWNHLYIQTGDLHIPNGGAVIAGGLTCAGFHDTGNSQIDGSEQVNNSLTVYNGVYIGSGNLGVNGALQVNAGGRFEGAVRVGLLQVGNLPYIYDNGGGSLVIAGQNIYNDATITTAFIHSIGNYQFDGWGHIGNGMEVYNSLTVQSGNFYCAGQITGNANFWIAGSGRVGQLQVGNLPYAYDNGGNYLIMPYNLNVLGATIVNGSALVVSGFNVNGPVGFNSDLTVNGSIGCNGALSIGNGGASNWIAGTLDMGNSVIIHNNIYPSSNGDHECGVCQHQWRNVFSYNFVTESDPRKKRDIEPVPEVCLELVKAIRPSTFKWRDPGTVDDHGQPLTEDHPYANTHWGFMHPDVMGVMNDPARGLPVFGGAYIDQTYDVKLLQYNELVAVLWQAVRELSDKVEQLQATKH